VSEVKHTYAPLQRWGCDVCGASGDLGRFPAGKYAVDIQAFAERLHQVASPGCTGIVRVTQEGESYPD
jgi:hypothetical protein